MSAIAKIAEMFTHWLDAVVETATLSRDCFARPRSVKLIEISDGEFEISCEHPSSSFEPIRIVDGKLAGIVSPEIAATLSESQIELVLRADRFMFRPFELPSRAGEFLKGIVTTQIDRLTPWNASEAIFGWTKPADVAPDRIEVTVAATSASLVKPIIAAIAALGVRSVSVFTRLPEAQADQEPIKLWEEDAREKLHALRLRHGLAIILAGSGLLAATALLAAFFVGAGFDAEHDDLARQIAKVRASIAAAGKASDLTAVETIIRRKNQFPAMVVVLEKLSQVLPDDTYVTELRIEEKKVRISGLTREAAALIPLIEQSGLFAGATFFAPTTRSSSEATKEQFYIETTLLPLSAARS